jgi:nucleoside-diphosphate-sugar epimerase
MPSVVITGASGALGRRIVSRLAETGGWSVIAIDQQPFPTGVAKPRHFTAHRVNLATAPLERLMHDATALIHLATTGADGPGVVEADVALLDRTLLAGEANGVHQIILLSSAVVYGAWADNPVPMSESVPLRPNPGFTYGIQKRAVEARAGQWRARGADRTLAILRPATTLGHPDARAWLAESVAPNLAERVTTTLPPTQFVHVDDLADAVVHALVRKLDGPFNVASTDWLTSDAAHALFGPALGFPVPDQVAAVVRLLAQRFGKARPAGANDYVAFPWVVASDRLLATGWVPKSSSAEAYVASKRQSMFGRLYARRRQEVNLAAVTVGSAGILGAAAGVLRWWRNRYLR